MFGTPANAVAARTVPLAGPAPTPMASDGRMSASRIQASQEGAKDYTPWILLALLAIYVFWALIERHQRVRSLIQPKNVAINLRNLFAIIVPVVLGLSLARILLVKVKVWTRNLPYVSDFVGALVHIVGS